jgi:putative acetyltransferase
MAVIVRPLRPGEERRYLEIVNRAIRGLASTHYLPEAIEGWVVPVTDDSLRELIANPDREVRLIAEIDGAPVGIGALVVERSELRACYVSPDAARRGCGRRLVEEIERLARARGLTRLEVASSLNAEPFYARLGYRAREQHDVVLRNGHRLPAVMMEKTLE